MPGHPLGSGPQSLSKPLKAALAAPAPSRSFCMLGLPGLRTAPQDQLDSSQTPMDFFWPLPHPKKTQNCFATEGCPRTWQGRPFGNSAETHVQATVLSIHRVQTLERGLNFIRKPSFLISCPLSQTFLKFPAFM